MKTSKQSVRTRYAPSPTGYLHIGGARSALFNYLFAKHHNGDFIFRCEDSDIKRNVANGEKSQLDGLNWLNINPDESPFKPNRLYQPYRQSEKLSRYHIIANWLLDHNHAYYAFDSKEELEQQKAQQAAKGIYSFRYDPEWLQISEGQKQERFNNGQYVIRLRLAKNKIYQWNDLVRGTISFNTDEIGDWVIIKANGYPTYNFAVVIDDHDMAISHVFRGEEHLSNTPKQLVLYDLLQWNPPAFGHLTIITDQNGKKLSKRDQSLAQFISDYQNQGYPPAAIFNYLALLGWTSGTNQELFSKQELIKAFDYQRLSKAPAQFTIEKMNWFAKHYFKLLPLNWLIKQLKFKPKTSLAWKRLFINTFQPSHYCLKQLQQTLDHYQNLSLNKPLSKHQLCQEPLQTFINLITNKAWTVANIQAALNQTKIINNLTTKTCFSQLRQLITNQAHGPELAITIFLLTKPTLYRRLQIKS